MRTTLLRTTITSLIILGVLLGGYYFLFLKPRLALLNTYEDVQKTLVEHRMALLHSRLAFVNLTRVNPNAPSATAEISDLTTAARNSNNKALSVTQATFSPPSARSAPTAMVRFITNELPPVIITLQEKGKIILEQQQPIANSLSAINSVIGNILAINPNLLQSSISPTNNDQLIKQADIGIENLNDTLRATATLREEHPIDTTPFEEQIHTTQQYFSSLIVALEESKTTTAKSIQSDIARELSTLKQSAFALLLSPIKNENGVSLLTQQTNLILEYDFWLEKLNLRQAKI